MSGFGGFGSTSQAGGGFGTSAFGQTANQGGGFGATSFGSGASTLSGSTLFGGGGNSTGGFGSTPNIGFGSGTSGFGTSGFGQSRTGFGTSTTTSAGLFGSTTATSGAGGFGTGAFGTSTTGGFGSGGTSVFGANKPTGFGATGTTGGPMFGGGTGANTANAGFGAAAGQSTGAISFGAGFGVGAAGNTNNGTGSLAFTPFEDKDSSTSTSKNQYQSISAMTNYQKFSPEELRLADYAQGRKVANQSGQAGAFGATSGFGGFGTSGGTGFVGGTTGTGGMFGTSGGGGFGAQPQTQTGAFGATGAFGSQKPAGTSLFGATTTSGQTGAGMFGTAGATSGGGAFGSTPGAFGTQATGGFGQQQQTKPLFGGTSAGGGFGGTSAGFGAPSSSTPFGGATTGAFGQKPAATGTGGFGGFGQQQTTQPAAGAGSVFGAGFGQAQQQQQKPGLFGQSTTTQSNPFNQPAQQTTSVFGGAASQPSTTAWGTKPATGTGMFGAPSSGFGGTGTAFGQPAQTGGSIFGGPTAGASMFGQKPTATLGGGSIFGQGNMQQSSSPFGQSLNQPTLGSFGASQQAQPQQQAFRASLADNPYGNSQLFASLQTPTQSVGPLATPLSTSQKARKQAVIPQYRLTPSASTRLITPSRRPQGYGFSYSTYGTPGSAASNASPMGLGNSLLSAGGLGRSLNKSLSTSNLRHSFTAHDSILAPGAFTGAARLGTSGSKRLTINRNINTRRSLFDDVSSPTVGKKVTFEKQDAPTGVVNGDSQEGGMSSTSGALARLEPSPEPVTPSSRTTTTPEMQQVNGGAVTGKELAIVPENGIAPGTSRSAMTDKDKARLAQKDQTPGEYFMRPTLQEIMKMGREERANIQDFVVGRSGCGQITFHKVDLTNVPVQKVCGQIVKLEVRSATVYGEDSPVPKPLQGTGLNVQSTIVLENSWPRAKAGRLPVHEQRGVRFEKHIERLKRVPDTKFQSYNVKTGEWAFSVEHYTTYGLDYDDDESTMAMSIQGDESVADHIDQTPSHHDNSMLSSDESIMDDTFAFKKKDMNMHLIPGQFDDEDLVDASVERTTDEFRRAADSDELDNLEKHETQSDESQSQVRDEEGMDVDMAGSFPAENQANGREEEEEDEDVGGRLGTPSRIPQLELGTNWAEQLQYTASPKKQDRDALRNIQMAVTSSSSPLKLKKTQQKPSEGFTTSIDIMNSLFIPNGAGTAGATAEIPHAKRPKRDINMPPILSEDDENRAGKPSWGPDGVFVYGAPGNAPELSGRVMTRFKAPIVGEHQDVRFARFAVGHTPVPLSVEVQRDRGTTITHNPSGIPHAITDPTGITLSSFADSAPSSSEAHLWSLASILFDPIDPIPFGPSSSEREDFVSRTRKSRLSSFWRDLVRPAVQTALKAATSPEDRALVNLTGGDVPEACSSLLAGGDIHLATLLAQMPGDAAFRGAIAKQLENWGEFNVLSEFSDTVRGMYELVAGHTCVSSAPKTAPGVENMVKEIVFSERFRLDWMRAFGLRLWFGGVEEDGIEHAVRLFGDDLRDGKETAKPLPSFKMTATGKGVGMQDAISPLWGLLQIYAASRAGSGHVSTDFIARMLAPENVAGSAMDTRLSFQLVSLLSAQLQANSASLTPSRTSRQKQPSAAGNDSSAAASIDDLAVTYALTLSASIPNNQHYLPLAIWSLLHVSLPDIRHHLIQSLLNTHADLLDADANPKTWNALVDPSVAGSRGEDGAVLSQSPRPMGLPAKWLFAAKALYARAVLRDPLLEARWLVEAGDLVAAHAVLCDEVGPRGVLERWYEPVQELVWLLVERSGGRNGVAVARGRGVSDESGLPGEKLKGKVDWERGAGLFDSFVRLVEKDEMARGMSFAEQETLRGEMGRECKRVGGVLRSVSVGAEGRGGVIARIAAEVMKRWVAECAERWEVADSADSSMTVLMPVPENKCLQQAKALREEFYANAVALAG